MQTIIDRLAGARALTLPTTADLEKFPLALIGPGGEYCKEVYPEDIDAGTPGREEPSNRD